MIRIKSNLAVSIWAPIVSVGLLWALRDVVVLVAYAVLLAYALLPPVQAIQRIRLPGGRRVSRPFAAVAILLLLALAGGWAAAVAIPRLTTEAERFVASVPAVTGSILETLRSEAARRGLGVQALENLGSGAGDWLRELPTALARVAGGMFGGMARMLTFALVPLLAFYLLADARAIEAGMLRFLPHEPRSGFLRVREAVDRALRSYVRGQAIVCVVMAVAVGLGLAIARHPASLLLGVLVGAAEIVPYAGFAVAAIAIVLAGWTVSPLQALLGVGLYIAINWAVGTFVTPRVMSRHLQMHPFLVTVSVIAGSQLMGPAGALLALPAAATLQALVAEMAHGPETARSTMPTGAFHADAA